MNKEDELDSEYRNFDALGIKNVPTIHKDREITLTQAFCAVIGQSEAKITQDDVRKAFERAMEITIEYFGDKIFPKSRYEEE